MLGLVLALSLFGLLMVYNSSVVLALRDFGDPFYYVKEQMKWLVLGLGLLIIATRIDYRRWYNWSVPLLLVILVLLVAVFLPGIGTKAYGAHRWINLGFTVLQPAELTKLVLVIYLSAWFSTREQGRLGAFLLLMGMVIGLVVLEPDLGTATIILGVALSLYFFSGAAWWQFSLLAPVILVGILLLTVAAPYRMQRLLTFLDPQSDPMGASYQIRQALLAFGSGGVFGVGLGQSRQKYAYLPEANTDSIFAVVGEELGFVGATFLIGVFILLISRGFAIARSAPDVFSRLLTAGVTSWIALQTIMNIGAMVVLIPLTGVPLPFISYGGSSLVVMLVGIGIVLNISRYAKTNLGR